MDGVTAKGVSRREEHRVETLNLRMRAALLRNRAREIKRQERERKEKLAETVREELWSSQGGKKGRALLSSSLRSPVARRGGGGGGGGSGGGGGRGRRGVGAGGSASASKASSSSSSSSSYKTSIAREKAKAVQSLRERYAREKKRRAQQKTSD